jgi:hypothetical protein
MFEIISPSAIAPHNASACSPLAAMSSGISGPQRLVFQL